MPFSRKQERFLHANKIQHKHHRLVDSIEHGDKVTIITQHGQEFTGKAYMKSSLGDNSWVLGAGKFGSRVSIASDSNVIKVKRG